MWSLCSCAKHAVMCAQNHRCSLGPIQTCKSGPKVAVLHEKNTQMSAATHIDLSYCWKSRCFACTKRQVRAGTHRDLSFWSKRRCFAFKNQRSVLWPIETSNSDANHAGLHAKTTGEVWDPQRVVILVLITMVCMHQTTSEVWDPYRLVILLRKSPFSLQKPQMRARTHWD